ncbi:ABC transporter permease [Dethiothermospora halolimnae]|uniref:ABC transporter permease n=1 Tax=Dethiothermospora halolimnae TaxID=3114390 RepID=UPI003CCB7D10
MVHYLQFAKNAFQSNLSYRMSILLSILHRVAALLVEVSIWSAVISITGKISTSMGTIDLNEMITYAILSTGISTIISSNIVMDFEDKVRTGQIAMDLIKPMKFKLYLVFQNLGNNLFKVIFELTPVVIIGILCFGINIPSKENAILFAVALLNGMIIYFILTCILGQLSFWILTVWHLDKLLNDMLKIFSGRFIPLWFFPKTLISISVFLPFRLIYFSPMSIYLGKINIAEAENILMQQGLWILILFIIDMILWKKGIKKLVVQGG